jgi:hypothetical protein
MDLSGVKAFLPRDKYSLATGFMTCMVLVVGFAYMDYHSRMKSISESKAGGVAWVQNRTRDAVFGGVYRAVAQNSSIRRTRSELAQGESYEYVSGGIGGGGGGGGDAAKLETPERKIVRKGALSILAKDTDAASQSIQKLARDLGGFVVSAERSNGGTNDVAVSIDLRIPSERLDEAWATIRRSADKVEAESMQARDVTKEYIDLDATLRNYQAEEAQYLVIMKQARSVKDTLDVSEHLSQVRGSIEKTQGELKYLQHDIEMSEINVQVHAVAVEKVMGITWRPLYQTKVAFRDSMQALADYCDNMVAFVLYLPVLIVWGITILGVAILAFRTLRYVWRRVGRRPEMSPAQA